ncbi:SDR family NAD(P)-dependent oxidoreductase [Nonomuraea terrae]|uniref:SDR family NAD(P)-dependent oxidoreductase n=1 Tax=Nonomuraea terrae TaxID=2530383 RepID=UPI0037B9B523
MNAVLITGGTSGLGYEAARRVASGRNRVVVITGRDLDRVERTAERMRAETGGDVRGRALDLGSLAEVRRFAAAHRDEGLPLDAVACNAGVQVVRGLTYTRDGYETTFAVNHLAHFALVDLLLPMMAGGGRIVFVSSGTHDPAQHTGVPAPRYTSAAELARPPEDHSPKEGRRRYATSKLCNVLTAYELARRHPELRVNAFDPGLMPGTGLARDYPPLMRWAWRRVLPVLTLVPALGVRTPQRSGAALAELLVSPRFADTTGRYFTGLRPTRSSEQSYDRKIARELWEGSAELTAPQTG